MPHDYQSRRVLIAAEHASSRYGGEAILPLHLFRGLRWRGIEAWLVVHARTRDELESLFPDDLDRIHFIPDAPSHRLLHWLGRRLPDWVAYYTTQLLIRVLTQRSARRVIERLVAEHRIDVVHQPIPVSPREPSLIHGVGAPVLMGPMNGGMSYPKAFRGRQSRFVSAFMWVAHWATGLLHRLMPGKLRAEVLLVANDRTRAALPVGVRGEVLTMIENGVDLSIWYPAREPRPVDAPLRVIFVGRLIPCKAVDLLLEALAKVVGQVDIRLQIAGDGQLRESLEARSRELGLDKVVEFLGWVSQDGCAELLRRSDVLVLPCLHECGGAVVLEAMATELPVIAANWGGPADYLDPTTGILVAPTSEREFVEGIAESLVRLNNSPELRRQMGHAGRERILRDFDWDSKIEDFLAIYDQMSRVEAYQPQPYRPNLRAAQPAVH